MILLPLSLGQALAAKDVCADDAARTENSAHIQSLYDDSEAEREDRSAQATSVLARDEQRIKELLKLDKKGLLCTPEDKWHAAWVMQQADDVDTLGRAYELAVETMEARLPRGPWLVAFSFDRKRTAKGYRQSYGTQTRVNDAGKRCLIELEGDITDEQRGQYGVPSLEKIYRQILDLNGLTQEAATVERMNRNMLFCPPVGDKRIAPPE